MVSIFGALGDSGRVSARRMLDKLVLVGITHHPRVALRGMSQNIVADESPLRFDFPDGVQNLVDVSFDLLLSQ